MTEVTICRTCLSEADSYVSVFKNIRVENVNYKISTMVNNFTNLNFVPDEELPTTICGECVQQICKSYFFRKQCIESDATLRSTLGIVFEELVEEEVVGPSKTKKVKIEKEYHPVTEPNAADAEPYTQMEEVIESIFGEQEEKSGDGYNDQEYMENDEKGEVVEEYLITDEVNTEDQNQGEEYEIIEMEATESDDDFDDYIKLLENRRDNKLSEFQYMIEGNESGNEQSDNENEQSADVNEEEPEQEVEKKFGSVKSRKPYKCYICGKRYHASNELKLHLEIHLDDPQYDCQLCGIEFRNQRSYLNHTRIHSDTSTMCYMCGKDCKSNAGVKTHITENHSDIVKPFSCFFCELAYKSTSERKKHMVAKHPELWEKHHVQLKQIQKEQSSLNRPTIMCEVCGKECYQGMSLSLHMMNHANEKPYNCELCGKGFTTANYLKDHMDRHTAVRNIECDICGKLFSRARSLKDHKKRHEGLRPFECHICNIKLASRPSLTMHIRTHYGEKPYREQELRRAPRIRRKKKSITVHTDEITIDDPLEA